MTFRLWNGMNAPVEPTYAIEDFDFYIRFRPDDIWSVTDIGGDYDDNPVIEDVNPYGAIVHAAGEGKMVFSSGINLYSFWVRPTA